MAAKDEKPDTKPDAPQEDIGGDVQSVIESKQADEGIPWGGGTEIQWLTKTYDVDGIPIAGVGRTEAPGLDGEPVDCYMVFDVFPMSRGQTAINLFSLPEFNPEQPTATDGPEGQAHADALASFTPIISAMRMGGDIGFHLQSGINIMRGAEEADSLARDFAEGYAAAKDFATAG